MIEIKEEELSESSYSVALTKKELNLKKWGNKPVTNPNTNPGSQQNSGTATPNEFSSE
tara:strand:+ start:125 stop:298 length:174 start_codon:yes stop_codon:yes gene_type:complete